MCNNPSKSPVASLCPLCQESNACANLSCRDDSEACWCHNSKLQFPKGLLEKLPEADRGKACICQKCIAAFFEQNS